VTLPKNLAIPSSGDPEKDRRDLEAAYVHRDRVEANICANGCGPMVRDDPHTRHCPVCNYVDWCSRPVSEGNA
jgi:hypothetical protein